MRHPEAPRTAFLGLGAMGLPMATNLVRGGVPLTVWNRTTAKAGPLGAEGATVASRLSDAAVDVVLTMLTDLRDVEEVLDAEDGLLEGWLRNGVETPLLVIMGTVSPPGVQSLAERLAASAVRVVDAPVSGGDVGAVEATLSIMVGGERADVDQVRPLFELMGRVVRHLGPVGSGQVAKACNQIIVASTAMVLAEAFSFARTAGVELDPLVELLKGGLADSEMLRQKGWRYLEREYGGGGALRNQVKDLRFALELGRREEIPLPMTAASEQFFTALVAMGYGGEDHTAAQRIYEITSGADA
ncbi:2-hydroxy-3-oxopropionate reductase [Luteimicrobium album]|uniref:2-hydroxy-3-oxopropionate reductase n=1 Tax=Luteimicrobium album TaxID=1054550 RepID=A0ABQ6I172_9MICO|nr:NAD(P)-dependent oxidoreductase [Luteimicrobium album]GMA24426.1 2-hydroxy-3-oxopropionate reductase [Luteimicrobium album]